MNSNHTTDIRPYPQESLLVDAVAEMAGERALCTSPGLAQFAVAAARELPQASVSCLYLDLYRANLALENRHDLPHNLRITCASDFDEDEVDVIALPFSSRGEAELTRELAQTGYQRLRPGGRIYAATDNREDVWLRDQLTKLFKKLERRAAVGGVLYVGTKTEPLKRVRNFTCEFAFRDRGRLIRAISRPGVFSHRSVDAGARHLMNEMEVVPGTRVLDIGCGSGVVALAAACRAEDVLVHAVDSNCRAVQCTQQGAELNGLTNLTTELNANGEYSGAGTFDLALANPPYYANFRITQHFLTAGRDALRAGGTILVVTKSPQWYQQNMSTWFDDVHIDERKGYHLIRGTRPPR